MQKKIIQIIKDNNLLEAWNEFEKSRALVTEKIKPYLVSAGILKAGKSNLLNAIAGQKELFPTGLVRKTTENKKMEFEHYILIDTPGIDANQADTAEAERAYKEADIILFVHNLEEGEFLKLEVDFINHLKTYYPNEYQFWDNVVFVLTHESQVTDSQLETISEAVKKQLQKVFNKDIPLFIVDSVNYLKGFLENKKLLIEKSGINQLKTELSRKLGQAAQKIADLQKERIKECQRKIIANLDKVLEAKKAELKNNNYDSLKKHLTNINQCKNKINELVNSFHNSEAVNVPKIEAAFYFSSSGFNRSSDYEYRWESSAESEGAEQLNGIISVAREAYIDRRIELIKDYKKYLPQEEGRIRIVSVAEKILNQAKELANSTLHNAEISTSANINITIKSIPEKISEYSGTYRYAALDTQAIGSTRMYKIKEVSYYVEYGYIKTERGETYVDSWFGEKWVKRYSYSLWKAIDRITEHGNAALNDDSDDMKYICQSEVDKYKDQVFKEMNQIKCQIIATLDNNQISEKLNTVSAQAIQTETQIKELENAINFVSEII